MSKSTRLNNRFLSFALFSIKLIFCTILLYFYFKIIIEAKDSLKVLSAKLGDNLFMFENRYLFSYISHLILYHLINLNQKRPSLLDAYLFGYLSVLSQAPFVNSPVKSYFLSCLNLEPLVKRIRRELFVVEKKGKCFK